MCSVFDLRRPCICARTPTDILKQLDLPIGRRGGRSANCVVGDDMQAPHGWAGADPDAMALVAQLKQWAVSEDSLPLLRTHAVGVRVTHDIPGAVQARLYCRKEAEEQPESDHAQISVRESRRCCSARTARGNGAQGQGPWSPAVALAPSPVT